jgi:hypothetical protein
MTRPRLVTRVWVRKRTFYLFYPPSSETSFFLLSPINRFFWFFGVGFSRVHKEMDPTGPLKYVAVYFSAT